MLLRIRADNLDLDRSYVRAMRDANPGITGNLKRINGVRDYGTTEAQIILGNGIADTISGPSMVSLPAREFRMACSMESMRK
jgi:hypothetical protein